MLYENEEVEQREKKIYVSYESFSFCLLFLPAFKYVTFKVVLIQKKLPDSNTDLKHHPKMYIIK